MSKICALVLSMMTLVGVFQGKVFAVENNQLEMNQESSDYLERIEAKYGGEMKYEENINLTEEEIAKRFDLIDTTYSTGEAFSDKDAEFIVNYAQSKECEPKTRAIDNKKSFNRTKRSIDNKKSFNRTKTRYNVTVTIKGHVRTKNGLINHSYGGTFYADVKKGSHVASLKNVITHRAYGLVGDSGTYIGLVHDSATSSKTSKKWRPNLKSGKRDLYIDNDKKYTAGPGIAYSRTDAYVRVTTKVGSTFTLQAFD